MQFLKYTAVVLGAVLTVIVIAYLLYYFEI